MANVQQSGVEPLRSVKHSRVAVLLGVRTLGLLIIGKS